MGHKVHPIGFRLGVIRDWDAKWYADKHYMEYLQEDLKLREVVSSMYPEAGVSTVEIDRQANNVSLTIHTARPGILIGRGGQRVDELRANLETLVGKRVQLNIREVPQPELDAYLVARNVADQIGRRLAYRRTLKQAILRSMQAGAKGMKISCAGRLDGAEIARRVTMHEGQVPLHTLRADIDYGFAEARTAMGRVGIKVWLYKGEILPMPKEVEAEAIVEPAAVLPVEEAAGVAPEAVVEEAVVEEEMPVAEPAVAETTQQPVITAPEAEITAEAHVEVVEAEPQPSPAPEAKPVEAQPARKRRTTKAVPAETVAEGVAEAQIEPVTEAQPAAEAEEKVAEEKPVRKRRSRAKAAPKAKTEDAEDTVAENADTVAEPSGVEVAEEQGDSDATA